MKKIVSFDIDGVLAQFVPGFIKAVKKVFPDKQIPKNYQPSRWEFSDILTPEEFPSAWKEAVNTNNFWSTLEPYEDNVESMKRFIASQHDRFDVYYITSRVDTPGDSAFSQTSKWLIENDLLWYNTSLLVVKKAEDKIPILRGLRIDASIDDYLPTVVSSSGVSGHEAFLYDRPWNQENRPENLKVVSNLEEYFSWIGVVDELA